MVRWTLTYTHVLITNVSHSCLPVVSMNTSNGGSSRDLDVASGGPSGPGSMPEMKAPILTMIASSIEGLIKATDAQLDNPVLPSDGSITNMHPDPTSSPTSAVSMPSAMNSTNPPTSMNNMHIINNNYHVIEPMRPACLIEYEQQFIQSAIEQFALLFQDRPALKGKNASKDQGAQAFFSNVHVQLCDRYDINFL